MQSSLSRPHSRCNLNCVPNSKKPISPSTSSSRGSDSLKSFLSLHPKRSHSTSPPSLLKPAYRCHSQNISSKPISFPAMKHSPLSANHHPRLRKCSQFHCVNSSNPSSADKISIRRLIEAIGEALLMSFPVWVALGCLMGLVKPSAFSWVRPELTILGLTVIMLGMGMTLTLDDLRGAFAMPRELLTGFVLQYSVMPLSGYFISKLLGLPSYSAAGLILVACCPGGTASNIVTYIARGNVALSVLMTAASTILAVVMTSLSHGPDSLGTTSMLMLEDS
ncbi:Probable sodium/metabolite cotransporter bass1, chloroplastic [Ancistrocladus abbreviatus]